MVSYTIAGPTNVKKKKEVKQSLRVLMLQIGMINIQGKELLGLLMASMQILASPSKITWLHLSILANCIAHSKASVSTCSGEDFLVVLAQILTGTPRWSLAIIAIAIEEFDVVASMLILIIPKGGGDHWCLLGQGFGGLGGIKLGKIHGPCCEWDGWNSVCPRWNYGDMKSFSPTKFLPEL